VPLIAGGLPQPMPDLQFTGESLCDDVVPSRFICRVSVASETDAEVDVDRIQAAVQAAFSQSAYEDVTVSVAIVDDEAIHELNRQFLSHDYPTDVLSFPLEDAPPRIEGEIIVSADTAERCASDAGWTPSDELLLYVIHGALHLAGFRDKEPAQAAVMRAREAAALASLGVALSPRDSRWQAGDTEGQAS
jgi:probable rRNA maturation factor